MTPETRLALILERLTYKPGWKFTMFPLMSKEGQAIGMLTWMSRMEPDVTNPNKQVGVGATRSFTFDELRQCSEERIVNLIAATIMDAELHEMNEWLKFDGKCVEEPRHELAA